MIALLSFPIAADVCENARLVDCLCGKCTLAKQDDFRLQKSGLEEVYDEHNRINAEKGTPTYHFCKFLPKFHPELNPIERVWGRMKWHIRKYSTGKLDDLEKNMNDGLGEEILPIVLIRKFIRLISAYYIAYVDGLDLIAADAWIRKHRSHRSHSIQMDHRLEALYFPANFVLYAEPPTQVHSSHAAIPVTNSFDDEIEGDAGDDDDDDEEYWDGVVENFVNGERFQ